MGGRVSILEGRHASRAARSGRGASESPKITKPQRPDRQRSAAQAELRLALSQLRPRPRAWPGLGNHGGRRCDAYAQGATEIRRATPDVPAAARPALLRPRVALAARAGQ